MSIYYLYKCWKMANGVMAVRFEAENPRWLSMLKFNNTKNSIIILIILLQIKLPENGWWLEAGGQGNAGWKRQSGGWMWSSRSNSPWGWWTDDRGAGGGSTGISMEVRGWQGSQQGEDGQASIAGPCQHSWSHAYCIGWWEIIWVCHRGWLQSCSIQKASVPQVSSQHVYTIQGGSREQVWEEDLGDHDGQHKWIIDGQDAQHLQAWQTKLHPQSRTTVHLIV